VPVGGEQGQLAEREAGKLTRKEARVVAGVRVAVPGTEALAEIAPEGERSVSSQRVAVEAAVLDRLP